MSYEQENKQALVAYFNEGAKGDKPLGALGVEVEHFVVTAEGEHPVSYAGGEGEFGVREVLAHLADAYPQHTHGLEGDLIGLASDEASITLEPAAQLEISIAPYLSIGQILRVYSEFRSKVDPFLAEHGCKLVTSGYHPTARALELTLIPKQRYRFMNNYFMEIGTHGERMMRASASTQVSVDYRDEADAIRKMRIAQGVGAHICKCHRQHCGVRGGACAPIGAICPMAQRGQRSMRFGARSFQRGLWLCGLCRLDSLHVPYFRYAPFCR